MFLNVQSLYDFDKGEGQSCSIIDVNIANYSFQIPFQALAYQLSFPGQDFYMPYDLH
jgi:hypothetical protein